MIQRTNQIVEPSHLSAETSRRILYKLRDLNLSAERILLANGHRVDFRGCLDADAPVHGHLFYRLTLDGHEERLMAIALDRGRLHLALVRYQDEASRRSRWLTLTSDEDGLVSAPQLGVSLDPDTANPDEVGRFLFGLTLACLPAG